MGEQYPERARLRQVSYSTPGAAMRYQHAAADRDAEIARRWSALVSDLTGTVAE
jgi:hypothetical protein